MKKAIFIVAVIAVVIAGVTVLWDKDTETDQPSPTPSISQASVTPSPMRSRVDYSTLPAKASCTLKGTIRYISTDTYDNGDALFIYKGVDHPGRNIFWTVTPSDGIDLGPDIFTQLDLPDGSSLLSVTLPEQPTVKRYSVTASIQYGRFVDGNLKVFTTPCSGATIIRLP